MTSQLLTPPILSKPFAEDGDKNTIPEDATGTQNASLEEGFPAITSTPISQGGIPPERKDFNGLGNLLSKQYFYLQNGGKFTFNPDVSDAIGGYPQGATLWYSGANGEGYYVTSLINNNTYNFVATPSYIDDAKWMKVMGGNSSSTGSITSNCLTKIPQDIEMELSSGTLTIKSGSKFYVPNGSGTFDLVTLSTDKTYGYSDGTSTRLLIYNVSTESFQSGALTQCYSGASNPLANGYWYDTTNNTIQYTSDSGTTYDNINRSLPLAMITVTNGSITAINKVFNGFGFFGSTFFALPGVEGLGVDGRETDGTLKSVQFTINQVITLTNPSSISNTNTYYVALDGNSMWGLTSSNCWYDADRNAYWNGSYSAYQTGFMVPITCIITAGVISNFNHVETFHAVGYDDLTQVHVVIKTYHNGTQWYRLYDDGWIEQGGQSPNFSGTDSTVTVTLNRNFSDTNYTISAITNSGYKPILGVVPGSKTISSFQLRREGNSSIGSYPAMWMAFGF